MSLCVCVYIRLKSLFVTTIMDTIKIVKVSKLIMLLTEHQNKLMELIPGNLIIIIS